MKCSYSENDIALFVERDVAPSKAREIEEHLGTCDVCRKLVEDLRELLDHYHGNLPLVLAGYNAGAAAVARFGTIPPFPETGSRAPSAAASP